MIECIVNASHDCVTHQCKVQQDAVVVHQERQPTSMTKSGVVHSNPNDAFILNSHLFRSHERLSIHYPKITASLSPSDIAHCAISCLDRQKQDAAGKIEAAEEREAQKAQLAAEKAQRKADREKKAKEKADEKKRKADEKERKDTEKAAASRPVAQNGQKAQQPDGGVRSGA